MNKKEALKPMYLGESLLFFGIPGLILYWNIYYGIPLLDKLGVPLIISFPLALYGLLGLLFFASLIAYKMEGRALSWQGIKERLRLTRMTKRMWFISLGAFVGLNLAEGILEATGGVLARLPLLSPPELFPEILNPLNEVPLFDLDEFMGVPMSGNWWLLLLWAICLACNIAGEEFWWRGYILPRQELAFGNRAWLVHGLLWLFLFHAFLKWNYIVLIPTCLLLPYLAQKYKNTWLPALIHGVGNALMFILLLNGILK